MSPSAFVNDRLAALGDRFLPPGLTDPAAIRRTRAAILQSGLGLFFTVTMGSLYAAFGSPASGAAIGLLTLGLLATPFAIRRGLSTVAIGNGMIGLTLCATGVVAWRSGGFASPATVWCFLLPLMAYVACGRRWVVVWAGASSLLLALLFAAELGGVVFAQDFTPAMLSLLRLSGYAGVVLATLSVLMVVDGVRLASQRAMDLANQTIERERILSDMHDGVGSQLLGLSLQARAGRLGPNELANGLDSCLDDLRLIVDSLDPLERPLQTALGELRSRVQPRCDAAGVELVWRCELGELPGWSASGTLQVLRALQEILSNALRHAQAKRIEVEASVAASTLCLSVRDDGVGFDPGHPPRSGRGLKNLRVRAQKLRGEISVTAATPGTRVLLQCPAAARGWSQ